MNPQPDSESSIPSPFPITHREFDIVLPHNHWNAEMFAAVLTEALAARYPNADTIELKHMNFDGQRVLGVSVVQTFALNKES